MLEERLELQAARAGAAVGSRPVGDLQAAVAEHRRGPVGRRLPEVDDHGVARHRHLVLQELKRARVGPPPGRGSPGPPDHARRDPGGGDRRRARGDPGPVDADHARPSAISGSMRVDLPREARAAGRPRSGRPRGDLRVARDAEVGGRERGRCARAGASARRAEPASAGPGRGEAARAGGCPRRAGASRSRRAMPGLPPRPRRYPRRHAWTCAHRHLSRAGCWGFVGSSPARGSLPTPTPGCAGHRCPRSPL